MDAYRADTLNRPENDRSFSQRGSDATRLGPKGGNVDLALMEAVETATEAMVLADLAARMRYWVNRLDEGDLRETLLRLQAKLSLASQDTHLHLVRDP